MFYKGPECFLARRTKDPTDSTVLKRRLLTLLGYKVTTVPYWEWGAVEGDGQTGTYVGPVQWMGNGVCLIWTWAGPAAHKRR